ncbi:MAG: monovalent cation:proton antiporter-2 (CPA2) family protein [Endozoicomonas sp.]
MTSYFIQAFIYLSAAVLLVPLAKQLGLGSVLGYLIAGVIIGPIAGLVGQETATIQHFAEFGVVMMLFLVGLELQPQTLWSMRHRLIGLGGLQISLTATAVFIGAILLNQPWTVSLAVGLIFSLSSTAIVLQTFQEKRLANTEGGNSAFSVLLFQDIAVIPMLAFMPLLVLPELQKSGNILISASAHHEELSLVHSLPDWAAALVVLAAIAGLVVGGHFLSRPLFRYVARSGLREVFTATALMLVVGIATLMSLIELSPALGTFLAGVVMANSEFRHELEADIEPFKGLLLGLFFITVGAGINVTVLSNHLLTIIGLTLALMLIKACVLYLLAILFKVNHSDRWLFTLSLAQAGEFGFVLLGYSVDQMVLSRDLAQMLSMVVALSMFLTPALFILFERIIQPRYQQAGVDHKPDTIDVQGPVLIAGIGRFGQVVNRLLVAQGVNTVVLDKSTDQIDMMRAMNIRSFYGDACRPDLLHIAGINECRLMIVTIDDPPTTVNIVKYIKHHYPHVQVLARAFDPGHHYELYDIGADYVISETYESALNMGAESLARLGIHPFQTEQMKQDITQLKRSQKDGLYRSWLEEYNLRGYDEHHKKLLTRLEALLKDAFQCNRSDRYSGSERDWTPSPKDYLEDFEDN